MTNDSTLSSYFDEEEQKIFDKVVKRAEAQGKKLTSLKKKNGEADIVKSILLFLNSIPGCKAKKRHGSIYEAGEPDIDCCLRGMTIKIEVKDVGEEVKENDAQDKSLKSWALAGAITFWTTSLVHTKQEIIDSGKFSSDTVDFIKNYSGK